MTKLDIKQNKIKQQIREIITRGYLAKPTGKSRAFPFMDSPEWEGFVKGCSESQVIELYSLYQEAYTVDELIKIFKKSPYSSGHTLQFLKWLTTQKLEVLEII